MGPQFDVGQQPRVPIEGSKAKFLKFIITGKFRKSVFRFEHHFLLNIMLGFTGGKVIARAGEFTVNIVPSAEYPVQKPPFDELLGMLDPQTLLSIFKKFKLKRGQTEILTNFYHQSENQKSRVEAAS